jgi:hypothetical protein
VVKQDANLMPLADEPGYKHAPECPGCTRHEDNRHVRHLPSQRNTTLL